MQVMRQPPSGGCVLKPNVDRKTDLYRRQPPSGGCVLKRLPETIQICVVPPAAFRRLCVETPHDQPDLQQPLPQPPSGGCVLKLLFVMQAPVSGFAPAAFRRLCVETLVALTSRAINASSRLQAAVC